MSKIVPLKYKEKEIGEAYIWNDSHNSISVKITEDGQKYIKELINNTKFIGLSLRQYGEIEDDRIIEGTIKNVELDIILKD